MSPRNQEIQFLEERYGICFGAIDFRNSQFGMDTAQALIMDAAPTNPVQASLVTQGNAGVPAFLTNFLDPKVVEVLVAPMRAKEIYGEVKKGDWTTDSWQIPMIESTGEVSTYGDYNNNGLSGANVQYEPRQAYTFQTFTKWGDRELERQGKAKIDWASRQNIASALTLNKFMNKSYFLGVTGLDNYGALNDPGLNASITPGSKTAGGTTWAKGTGIENFKDVQDLFKTLSTQTGGLVQETDEMILAMSPNVSPYLANVMSNVYGNATVRALIKETYPNMEIKTAVEFSTSAGEIIQLIAKTVQGQDVCSGAFTEKMRAHAIVRDTSSTFQKKSAGTWGMAIFFPAGIATGLGY